MGRQRKFSVGALERDRLGISPGDGSIPAFTTDFGKIGIPVCVDFWGQPEAGRHLADQGVDIVFNISASFRCCAVTGKQAAWCGPSIISCRSLGSIQPITMHCSVKNAFTSMEEAVSHSSLPECWPRMILIVGLGDWTTWKAGFRWSWTSSNKSISER